MTQGRTLPLVQDDVATQAWVLWGVTWRDVVIVNPRKERVAVYNLTTHNLADPANLAALKALLLEAR